MEGSLINVGGLADPATRLVEKISGAIGILYRPRQIRNDARAEAEAEVIRAVGKLEVGELHQRAATRLLVEEGRKQANIEAIGSLALPDLREDGRPEDLDDDWIVNFFERARLTSDEDMQALWARVLAGEANEPGSYSKRTVNALASFSREDADVFTALCRYCWWFHDDFSPVIYDVDDEMYSDLTFDLLSHLDGIGLLRYETLRGFALTDLPRRFSARYFDREVTLEAGSDSGNHRVYIGHTLLTRVGLELASVCAPTAVPGFEDHVLSRLIRDGFTVSSALQS